MKKSFLLISFMMGFIFSSYSQNTSSPYTRYGYGSLVDAGSGLSKSMGGLSFGLRPKGFINSGNPASYTAIDSMTFRFELGAEAKLSTYSDKNANQTTFDANLSYMALQFPITRWLGVSAGILPYSFVGYDFYQTDVQPSSMTNGSLNSQYDYEGKGGLTQAYFGLGVSPFRNFSVGVNVEYNFGDIEHTSDVSFTTSAFRSMCQSKKISVSDFNWLAGVQYEFDLDDQKHMTVGLVYEPKAEMNANATQQIYVSGVDTVNIVNEDGFETPMTVGFGVACGFSERFQVGLDYKRQNWSDVKYFGEKPFADRNRISAGAEFLPNKNSKRYLERIHYRLGANYSDSYIKMGGDQLNEFALSAGLGFPLKKGLNPTVINLSFEYGNMGSTADDKVREQYCKLMLSATINERWFVKRKIE